MVWNGQIAKQWQIRAGSARKIPAALNVIRVAFQNWTQKIRNFGWIVFGVSRHYDQNIESILSCVLDGRLDAGTNTLALLP